MTENTQLVEQPERKIGPVQQVKLLLNEDTVKKRFTDVLGKKAPQFMASITDLKWVKDIGYLDFVRYWGYDIQGAIYQKIVELNTGKKLPFFIAAVTKENEPDIRIIQITQNYLDEALSVVSANINRVLMVKNGDREPDKCELCDCCRHNRVLKAPISIIDLTSGI